ncbi:MAG: sigma-70 family RNA polymerase sigma factor [Anaerohalosphaera sp.]|nr:sigma-70 family RNA polymerase sigma factor [Anaerohalosphaera sp.]
MGFIRVMVPNRSVADDILQETTLLMWEKFEDFQDGTNFSAWGISIARNKILQQYRKEKRQHMMFDDTAIRNLVDESSVFDNDNDQIDALKKCTKKLPVHDQKLLEMRYLDNININQIAKKVNRSTSLLYRKMAKIHRILLMCIKRQLANLE